MADITPKRKAELNKARDECNALLNSCHHGLDSLAARWSDEKEYEDFAEYEKAMKSWSRPKTITFVRATKRPFGFEVTHKALPDRRIAFVVTRKGITWKLA